MPRFFNGKLDGSNDKESALDLAFLLRCGMGPSGASEIEILIKFNYVQLKMIGNYSVIF